MLLTSPGSISDTRKIFARSRTRAMAAALWPPRRNILLDPLHQILRAGRLPASSAQTPGPGPCPPCRNPTRMMMPPSPSPRTWRCPGPSGSDTGSNPWGSTLGDPPRCPPAPGWGLRYMFSRKRHTLPVGLHHVPRPLHARSACARPKPRSPGNPPGRSPGFLHVLPHWIALQAAGGPPHPAP